MIIDRLSKNPRPEAQPRLRSRGAVGLIAASAMASLVGCTDPPVDTQQPTVTGVIEGSVTYIGRRVDCDYDNGVPVAVRGRILMTLNDVANPLPPLGTATLPADFFAVGGEDIFTDLAADCLPEPANPPDPAADAAARAVNITRAVEFRWTSVKMGSEVAASERNPDGTIPQSVADAHAKHYTIQGFYDQEGDFNPLFSVAQSTSAGDIAGAALKDPLNSDPVLAAQFRELRFESTSVEPLGTVVSAVGVTLAAPVLTDPPIFRVHDGAISAEAKLTFAAATTTTYPRISLSLYERTSVAGDPRSRLDSTANALNRGGFADYTNPLTYAWYVGPVDVDSSGDADCPLGGGDLDCHPLEAAFGYEWNSPVTLMQRVRTSIEVAANIPSVALIPNAGGEMTNPKVQYPEVPLRMFPFAAVLTSPTHAECRAVYFVSGAPDIIISSSAAQLPQGTVVECNELPNGPYSVNVLGGIVATPATHVCPNPMDPACPASIPASESETGFLVTGGQFGAQVWSVPNDFGDYHQVGDTVASGVTRPDGRVCLSAAESDTPGDDLCVPEQSTSGAVYIHDPDMANAYGRRDPAAAGAGVCTAYDSFFASADGAWADDPSIETDFNDLCCRPIMHLCNVPLCPYVAGGVTPTWADTPAEQNLNVRGSPTSITGHVNVTVEGVTTRVAIPNCIPFPMPSQCCGAGNQP